MKRDVKVLTVHDTGPDFTKEVDELFGGEALEFDPYSFLAGVRHVTGKEPTSLLCVVNPYSEDDVYLLPDGNIFWGDYAGGFINITQTPPEDVKEFIARLEKIILDANS